MPPVLLFPTCCCSVGPLCHLAASPVSRSYFLPCSGSHIDEPEELKSHQSPLPAVQNQLTFDVPHRPSSPIQPSLDDLDVTPEKDCMKLCYTAT